MILEIHSHNPLSQEDTNKVKSILEESITPNESFKNTFGDRFICVDKTVDRVRVFFDSYFEGSHLCTFKDVYVKSDTM